MTDTEITNRETNLDDLKKRASDAMERIVHAILHTRNDMEYLADLIGYNEPESTSDIADAIIDMVAARMSDVTKDAAMMRVYVVSLANDLINWDSPPADDAGDGDDVTVPPAENH